MGAKNIAAGRSSSALILGVLYYANDLEVAGILDVDHAKMLANRVFTRLEKFFYERLIDHRDAG